MSINVNKITSTLAKLGDTELQQYAQMHKNDPYIMALAMSESNRRKELRESNQAPAQQEQPKVVDRMVAEMAPQQLPEEMGIARIPAGDMNFAGGGIVAFADGGDVERYQTGGTIMPALMAQYEREAQEMGAGMRTQFSPELKPVVEQLQAPRRAAEQSYLQREQAQMLQGPALLNRSGLPSLAAQPSTAPVTTPTAASAGAPSPTDPNFRRQQDPRMAGMAATAQPLITSGAAPTAGAGPKAPTAKTEPSAKTDVGGLDALIKDFTRKTDLALGTGKNARAELAAATQQIPKDRAARNEEERKKEGDVFAAREARLAEREKGVAGMKDKNFGLALLQAGAAMMSTPGNLGTAIGKGVQVGSERYIAGIDKINAAKEKFAEARDRLDELRLNRADMTKKEVRDEQRDIDNGVLQAKKLLVDGFDNDLKISNENQKALLGIAAESILTDKRIKGQLDAARISASRPPEQMQIAMALGGGNVEAGLRKIAEIQAGKFSVANSYADYLKAFAGKETLTPPLSFSNYAAQFGATLPR